MKIVFVNNLDFSTPSGMHIFHLANALTQQGVECMVYSRGNPETARLFGRPKFRSYGSAGIPPEDLAALIRDRGGDLVHCWTPRECARVLAEPLARVLDAPLVVHMEDNEDAIIAANTAIAPPRAMADGTAWETGGYLHWTSHPERYKAFLAAARGYTCIIESLLDFKPEHVPGHVFWPSCEPGVFAIPRESSAEEKARWGIPADHVTLFYPGNAHLNNLEEVTQLYGAVALLRRAGTAVRIIKFGNYFRDVAGMVFSRLRVENCLIDLTDKITPAQVPKVMRAADILVQPGRDDPYNHYRFPCKLPMFLASGRPVILPPANLGRHLRHGENCLLLQSGGAEEIYSLLRYLIKNPDMARRIGAAGREFARARFSWEKSAAGLIAFYREILTARG